MTISGIGFPAGVIVQIYLDTPDLHLGFPGPRSNLQGTFQETDQIPGVNPGSHTICADTAYPAGQPYAKACAPFVVTALASGARGSPSGGSGVPFLTILLTVVVIVVLAVAASIRSRRAS